MTKKEYRKARSALADFKATRIIMGLRLSFTLLAFIASFGVVVLSILHNLTSINIDAVIDNTFGGIWASLLILLTFDPISLFSLVYYGAYSSLGVSELFNSADALDWLAFNNVGMSLAVIGFFIFGFVLLMISFKALRKAKENGTGLIWLMLILTIENFVCIQRFGLNIFSGDLEPIWIYLIHAINLGSLILCCRSVFCVNYLNNHFEKGTAVKSYELKQMYENDDRDSAEV